MNATGEHLTRHVTGVCPHDCPDSCGWIVTVEDRPTGPVPVKLRGNPDHPYSQGELCPKVNRFLDRVLSDERVLTPMKRVGAKGEGRFEPITWDEALSTISTQWKNSIATHGGNALMSYRDAGNQSELSMGFPERLMSALGMSRMVGNVCGPTSGAGTALTYGTGEADDPMEIRFAKTILLWGTNTKLTNRHLWPFIEEAKANGATVVVIDPIRTMTAEAADVFIQPLPGTDVAMMLAMMHVIIRDDLIDHEFVREHTNGFDELAAHVATWTPEKAADICGITATEIESLAALYASGAPAFIRTIIGAEHAEHGGTFFRALTMLPVLIGAWKQRGGGYARSVGTYGSALNSLERPHLETGHERRPLQMNHLGRWLTDETLDPPVTSIIIWNCNPVVTIPNAELIRRGLEREDLFTVVHEHFITDTAKYADIVLPATTQIEQLDVTTSWGSPHTNWNHQAIPPMGESVSNTELFRRLATAMGLTHPDLHASDEELTHDLFADPGPRLEGMTADRLRAEGTVSIAVGPQRYADGVFGTANGKADLASDAAARFGMGCVPDWKPAHEGIGGDPALAERFPFLLATPKQHTRFLNSSYSHLPGHRDREGGPFVELCSVDAAALELVDGDVVDVSNDRGLLTLPVKVTERVRPGLIAVPFGWTRNAHHECGSANSLTSDTLANWGGGVAYNDTRVRITRHR
jgi:anaerobic selenocysteine-containing dehydrogenase